MIYSTFIIVGNLLSFVLYLQDLLEDLQEVDTEVVVEEGEGEWEEDTEVRHVILNRSYSILWNNIYIDEVWLDVEFVWVLCAKLFGYVVYTSMK